MDQSLAQPVDRPPGSLNNSAASQSIFIQCRTCGTADGITNHRNCRGVFRWEDNEEHQLTVSSQKPLPLILHATDGTAHTFEAYDTTGPDASHMAEGASQGASLETWRRRFLRRRMGRRPQPQRALLRSQDEGSSYFRWVDNFHLVGSDFTYSMSGDSASDKRLLFRDLSGTWHELLYGDGSTLGGRIRGWRAAVIRATLGGFNVVYGARGVSAEGSEAALEDVLQTYIVDHNGRLPLDMHMTMIQEQAVRSVPEATIRREIVGPNFGDYLLSLVASRRCPALSHVFEDMRWRERIERHFSRASRRQWVRALAARQLAQCKRVGSYNMAVFLYGMWKGYCHAFRDLTLLQFRAYILRDQSLQAIITEVEQGQISHMGAGT